MYRVLVNPTFDIESGKLLQHDGEEYTMFFPISFDRSVQKTAGNAASTATGTANQYGAGASQIGASLIPGLETQATNPTGFTPLDKARMLTSAGQAAAGVNSGVAGAGRLGALRTSTPGGFASALDEAARVKNRAMTGASLEVQNEDARLREQKRLEAQRMLQGLYGTDVNAQLGAERIVPEDLNTELAASKSGWLQNVEGVLGTLGGLAGGAGSILQGLNRGR